MFLFTPLLNFDAYGHSVRLLRGRVEPKKSFRLFEKEDALANPGRLTRGGTPARGGDTHALAPLSDVPVHEATRRREEFRDTEHLERGPTGRGGRGPESPFRRETHGTGLDVASRRDARARARARRARRARSPRGFGVG